MEGYARTSGATGSTLAFLAAWTDALHELGYGSGVYSSSASGIADLASKWGAGYSSSRRPLDRQLERAKNTDDPYVPSSAWTPHQRIHQYRGGHNETYGGVTINIDNDYVDGATVGTPRRPPPRPLRGVDSIRGVAATGPGEADGLGLRPEPADGADHDPCLSGRGPWGLRMRALRTWRGRLPASSRHRRGAPHAGPNHGFDISFPGRRARNGAGFAPTRSAREEERSCSAVARSIPVPLRISHLRSRAQRLRLRIDCEWPAGVECPGQILLRTKMATRRRDRGRLVTVRVARRGSLSPAAPRTGSARSQLPGPEACEAARHDAGAARRRHLPAAASPTP